MWESSTFSAVYLLAGAEGLTRGGCCEHLEVLLVVESPSETSPPGQRGAKYQIASLEIRQN